MKKKLIYISHKYGGNEENAKSVEEQVKKLVSNKELFNTCCFVSPIHCFGFMYETVDYADGLQLCLDLLNHCDGMLVLGEHASSVGVRTEKHFCFENNIPFIVIPDIDNPYEEEVKAWVESLTS